MPVINEQYLRATISKDLREFGYEECTSENVFEVPIFAAFAVEQLLEANQMLGGNDLIRGLIEKCREKIKEL